MSANFTGPNRLRPGVQILRTSPRKFLLVDSARGLQCEVGPQERLLLDLVASAESLDQVQRGYARVFEDPIDAGRVAAFVEQLRQLGLLETVSPDAAAPPPATPVKPETVAGSAAAINRLNGLFDVLVVLFGWIVHPVWLPALMVLAWMAANVAARHSDELWLSFSMRMRSWPPFVIIPSLLVQTMLLVSLPRAVLSGMTCRKFGGRLRGFGLHLWGGLVPLFRVQLGDSFDALPERGRRAQLAIDPCAQVGIGSLAILLWHLNAQRSSMDIFWLWLLPPCVLGLFLNGVVFFRYWGYWALCYGLGRMRLHEEALAETSAWLNWRPAPMPLSRDERFWYRLYGLAYHGFACLLHAALLAGLGSLVFRLGGAWVTTYFLLAAWFYAPLFWRSTGLDGLARRMAHWFRSFEKGLAMHSLLRFGGSLWIHWPVRLALFAVGAWGLGMIRYPNEISGECRVVPLAERAVRTPVAEEIVGVHVREGDYVEQGEVLFTLGTRMLDENYLTTTPDVEKAEAELDLKLNGHLPEEIEMAEQRANLWKTRFESFNARYVREELLMKRGAFSQDQHDATLRQRDVSYASLLSADANLDLLKKGFRDEEIRAAEAGLRAAQSRLNYYNRLIGMTRLKAPMSGYVATRNLEQRLGTVVAAGDLVAVVQDRSKLLVEMAATDEAALLIAPGKQAKVRLRAMNGQLLTGQVREVARIAQPEAEYDVAPYRTDRESINEQMLSEALRSGRNVVMLRIELDDYPESLAVGLRGFARVVVNEDDHLWRALARPVVRFLRTELWAWLP